MKIKRFLAACMALTLSLGALTGCGNSSSNTSADSGEVQGSADATDVNVGLIMGPPSMGLGWLIHENEEGNTFNHYNFDVAGVDYSAVSASLNQGDYDIATVPSNVAAILYNNPDMKEKVKVISIGNLGLLYIVTTDPTIQSIQNLAGRTVYSIGEGGPPEYTFEYMLEQYHLIGQVRLGQQARLGQQVVLAVEIGELRRDLHEQVRHHAHDVRVAAVVKDALRRKKQHARRRAAFHRPSPRTRAPRGTS